MFILRLVGGVNYPAEDRVFAEELRAALPPGDLPPLETATEIRPIQTAATSWYTDVGDVSWMIPLGEICAATFVPGVAAHSWQSTACAGMGIGQKAMVVAAKTLVLTVIDLLNDPKQVELARQSFEKRLAGRKYVCRLPADAKPRPIPKK